MGTADKTGMELPDDLSLPLFVYGAFKPGMPAYEAIRDFVACEPKRLRIPGELYVRDGLPLLMLEDVYGFTEGYLLQWIPTSAATAYAFICDFEPSKHYQWRVMALENEERANVLVARYPKKGNPQPLFAETWKLTDDPAFGPGLAAVREVADDVFGNQFIDDWQRFFRAQMAYLLLWSILERLSALCFGPGHDPMKRVKQLHELKGISDLVLKHVSRKDTVSDSRNPDATYKLDKANAKKCFDYYYQVRSNLSHRGKAVHNEVDKVTNSLSELLAITDGYLKSLRDAESRI